MLMVFITITLYGDVVYLQINVFFVLPHYLQVDCTIGKDCV